MHLRCTIGNGRAMMWSTKAPVDYSNSDLILVVLVTRYILDANADP